MKKIFYYCNYYEYAATILKNIIFMNINKYIYKRIQKNIYKRILPYLFYFIKSIKTI